MRSIGIKALCTSALVASLTGLTWTTAVAQGTPIQFRVTPTDRNPASCQRFDAALSRVHTFTPTADGASVRSAGGVNSTMTQTKPGIFTTSFSLGGTTLDVVADSTSSPKSLEVREPKLGCRWSAVAP